MESEKVKEIKKALECCGDIKEKCDNKKCYLFDKLEYHYCERQLKTDILTLINELEKENKILTKEIVYSNEKDLLGKPVILTIGGVPLVEAYNRIVNYKQDQQVIKELKEQNAKLLDSVESVQAGRCVYKCELTKKHLSEFAERLKEKSQKSFINVGGLTASAKTVTLHDIDETLKECLCDKHQ